jgi:integrase
VFLSKSRSGTYYLFYVDELGKRHKVSTRTRRKGDALAFLQSFTREAQEHQTQKQRVLLSQFAADFLAYSKSIHTPKTQRHFRVAFREFIRVMGDIPVTDIDVRGIEKFLAAKRLDASEWSARKYYSAIASALKTARRWKLIERNPFREVEKPKAREIVPVYFSKPEFQNLLSVVDNPDDRDLYLCAASTGLRLGELLSLRWGDIDFDRMVVVTRNSEIFTTKNRRNRSVPLHRGLVAVLVAKQARSASPFVFDFQAHQLKQDLATKRFKRYVREAGLNPKLHFHSLRHTFATWLVQAGVSLYEVQKLLGHGTISTTQIYAHLAASELHGAVNKISVEMLTPTRRTDVEQTP